MVPFMLITRIWVVVSCGRAEECPRGRGRGTPAALDPNHRFLIRKVGQLGLVHVCRIKSSNPFIPTTARAFWLGVSKSVVPRCIWVLSVKLLEFLQTAY